MKMTFLGTGGAFSRISSNYHNNVLIEFDDGYRLLLDCGTTALESLDQLQGFEDDPHKVDGVVVTHIHADHVGGLEELAFRNYFLENKRRIDLFVHPELLPSFSGMEGDGTDLWENSLKGGLSHIQDEEGNPLRASLETYFKVHADFYFKVRDCIFIFSSMRHVPSKSSFGLKIVLKDDGMDTGVKKILFTADATTESNFEYGPADIIFQDCSFFPKYPSTVHTHFEELCELSPEIRKRMCLMHYGDPENQPEDLRGMRLVKPHETFIF